MRLGKIKRKVNGTWVIRYDEKVVKNCFGCKPYDTFNELPIDRQTLPYIENQNAYFTEHEYDGGKYATLHSELDFLVYQAQELDMGYGDGWDNVFKQIEESLHDPMSERVKNWLRNKYNPPIEK
jgi:hypothetical protein